LFGWKLLPGEAACAHEKGQRHKADKCNRNRYQK